MEHVNHPKHYNQHPAGIECIDIIRHYTCDIANAIKYLWRAGLKPEMGKEDAEKEIEDLKKALWYIEDYEKNFCRNGIMAAIIERKASYESIFKEKTDYTIEDVCSGYPEPIKEAMNNLLRIGIIYQGCITVCSTGCITVRSTYRLKTSVKLIQQRILDIEHQLLGKELKSTVKAMNAFMTGQPLEAVDGEDYVSKPGCVRETEPEKYDPLNMIVAWGRVYSLTDEIRKKPNGALYSPCENCDLIEVCYDDWRHSDTSVCHNLCRLHQAKTNEYYREVGVAKYAPSFGTVEVVDLEKETALEQKRIEEEDQCGESGD